MGYNRNMAQHSPIILKLGGSILSEKKSGKPILRTAHIRRLARELALFRRQSPRTPIVLLHGAGSFGHPIAHTYNFHHQDLTPARLCGMGQGIHAVRLLADGMNSILLRAGLPIVPFQTSAMVGLRKERLVFFYPKALGDVLAHGGIPVFGGDVILDEHEKTAIASADDLAVHVAQKIPHARILFASDVDGVYRTFPPEGGERPATRLTRKELSAIISSGTEKHTRIDVTGAMNGKLRALLPMRRHVVVIFNGQKVHDLRCALRGTTIGTTVVL